MEAKVSYDKSLRKFIIETPFHMYDIVKGMPSRKWNPRRRAWLAPPIRLNLEYMQIAMRGLAWTDEALEAARLVTTKEAVRRWFDWPEHDYVFKTQPMPHQQIALNKSFGMPAFALFMDMGTGKTKVAIDSACAYWNLGEIEAMVVLVPLSISRNWLLELKKHATMEIDAKIFDMKKKAPLEYWIQMDPGAKLRVAIVGIESLSQGSAITYVTQFMTKHHCFMVVDESSTIKNHKSIRTKNCITLGQLAKYRMIMTGTPVSTGPENLFAQYQFLEPEIIGTGDYYCFRNRYIAFGGYMDKQIVGYENLPELYDAIRPYTYQVTKQEVLKDLKPITYEKRMLKMPLAIGVEYKRIKNQKTLLSGHIIKNTLEMVLRLHQTSGGFMPLDKPDPKDPFNAVVYYIEQISSTNPKLDEVMEIIGETGEQVVVWCKYNAEIELVRSRVESEGYSVSTIVGANTPAENHENAMEYQAGNIRVMVANPRVGGRGIELYAGSIAIYYSSSFSYDERDQSESRLHRHGQRKGVVAIDLLYPGVDELIRRVLDEKTDLATWLKHNLNPEL